MQENFKYKLAHETIDKKEISELSQWLLKYKKLTIGNKTKQLYTLCMTVFECIWIENISDSCEDIIFNLIIIYISKLTTYSLLLLLSFVEDN